MLHTTNNNNPKYRHGKMMRPNTNTTGLEITVLLLQLVPSLQIRYPITDIHSIDMRRKYVN